MAVVLQVILRRRSHCFEMQLGAMCRESFLVSLRKGQTAAFRKVEMCRATD